MRLNTFIDAQNSTVDFDREFSFIGEKPLFQIIKMYSDGEKPNAALKIAEVSEILESAESAFQFSSSKFQTLEETSKENSQKFLIETLGNLSKSAEEIGELPQALEFEKKKSALLFDSENLQISRDRMGAIERKIYEQNDQPKIRFRVDESFVSQQ